MQTQLMQFSVGGAPVTDLSRFKALCERLGNPQDNLRFIHIAGTNGKGSTSEYIANALFFQGYSVGKFTSPYLVTVEERIQINGENIQNEYFDYYLNIVSNASAELQTALSTSFSQFEVLTAMAFLYFNDKNVDYVVLETGIGGLLDCTNIVLPLVSIITTIDYDHMAILGNTIEQIASHKVGIIKENVPVVAYPIQLPGVMELIATTAKNKHATLIIPNIQKLSITLQNLLGTAFTYCSRDYNLKMAGVHQVYNAITAIEALALLKTGNDAVRRSLQRSHVPARLEIISSDPFIILDGAHNPSGISSAVALISSDKRVKYALIGMLKSKDYWQSLNILEKIVDTAIFVDDFNANAVPKEELENASSFKNVYLCKSTEEGLSKLYNLSNCDSIGLIIGSLYLAGKILAEVRH